MTSNKLILAENTETGLIGEVPEHFLSHPTFGATLREVKSRKTRLRIFEPAVDGATDNEDRDEEQDGNEGDGYESGLIITPLDVQNKKED